MRWYGWILRISNDNSKAGSKHENKSKIPNMETEINYRNSLQNMQDRRKERHGINLGQKVMGRHRGPGVSRQTKRGNVWGR